MPLNDKKVSRRCFLAGGVCLGAGAVSLGLLSGCQPKDRSVVRANTRFGFTTYTWGKDWDIDTLITNCIKAKAFGLELRTSMSYKHGVELELTADERNEVKKRFADSPVALVGIACGERFDSTDPDKLAKGIEQSKAFIKLSHDIGSEGLRVFPNDFHKGTEHDVTIAQIARSLNAVGKYAADYGQMVRLETHGNAGLFSTVRAIMDQVTEPNVKVKLNSSVRDTEGEGFARNFNMVRDHLGNTLHLHNMKDSEFPYQLQMDLLVDMGWDGWQLLEASDPVEDRLAAMIEQGEIWQQLLAKSLARHES